jgi:hypothetical protein
VLSASAQGPELAQQQREKREAYGEAEQMPEAELRLQNQLERVPPQRLPQQIGCLGRPVHERERRPGHCCDQRHHNDGLGAPAQARTPSTSTPEAPNAGRNTRTKIGTSPKTSACDKKTANLTIGVSTDGSPSTAEAPPVSRHRAADQDGHSYEPHQAERHGDDGEAALVARRCRFVVSGGGLVLPVLVAPGVVGVGVSLRRSVLVVGDVLCLGLGTVLLAGDFEGIALCVAVVKGAQTLFRQAAA